MSRKCFAVVPLLFCLAAFAHTTLLPLAYAGLDDGKAAYDRGDYSKAYGEFKPLAEQGNAGAQRYFGGDVL